MRLRVLAVLPCCLAMFGCATPPADIGRAPEMSPVGHGLQSDVTPFAAYGFPASPRSSPQSLWDDDRANLFRDVRASRVGDVLTVNIAMDDKAKLGNSSDRTTTAKIGNGFDISTGIGSAPFKAAPQFDLNSTSASKGVGNVDRSEKIVFSMAAVVTGVLPDGNMLVSGSQESGSTTNCASSTWRAWCDRATSPRRTPSPMTASPRPGSPTGGAGA